MRLLVRLFIAFAIRARLSLRRLLGRLCRSLIPALFRRIRLRRLRVLRAHFIFGRVTFSRIPFGRIALLLFGPRW